MRYGDFLIPQKEETIEIQVFHRAANSPYEYETTPSIVFKGKMANDMEKESYRIQTGVNGNEDSLFILSSNMPIQDLKVGDMVMLLGEKRYIQSIGYYFSQVKLVNMSLFSNEYIFQKCPKGLNIQ